MLAQKLDLIPDLIFKIETKQDMFNIDDETRTEPDLFKNIVQKTLIKYLLAIHSQEDIITLTSSTKASFVNAASFFIRKLTHNFYIENQSRSINKVKISKFTREVDNWPDCLLDMKVVKISNIFYTLTAVALKVNIVRKQTNYKKFTAQHGDLYLSSANDYLNLWKKNIVIKID